MRFRQRCSMIWLMPIVILIDRLTKVWSTGLADTVRAVPGILNFRGVENYGASFGLFYGRTGPIAAVVLILNAAVAFCLFRYPNMPKAARAGLWLVLAGGLSNLYDRLRYGFVIDFLEFDFVRFPVFNMADVSILAGCALCVLAVTRADRRRAHG